MATLKSLTLDEQQQKSKVTLLTSGAPVVRTAGELLEAVENDPESPVRLAYELLVDLESNTVERSGNVRLNHSSAAENNLLDLMISNQFNWRLPNSKLILYKLHREGQGTRLVVPDGLTRIRAAIAHTDLTGVASVPMSFVVADKKEFELVQEFTDGEIRPRPLILRVTELEHDGAELTGADKKRALQLAKFLVGCDQGDYTGHLKPSVRRVKETFDRYREPIMAIVNERVLFTVENLRRPCVQAAIVLLWVRDAALGKAFITGLAQRSVSATPGPVGRCFEWLTSINQKGGGSQLMKRLFQGVTFLGYKLASGCASGVDRVSSERNYLLDLDKPVVVKRLKKR